MARNYLFIPVVLVGLGFTSCTKDPVVENQEELITSLTVTFIPDGGGQNVNFSFLDEDGNGGKIAEINTSGELKPGLVYTVTAKFGNASVVPAKDITTEINEEAADHQVFYVFGNGLQESVTQEYLDTDINGFPVGLKMRMTPSKSGLGTMTVLLRHLPDKAASGVKEGNPANAGGETDVQVEFPVKIQ